MLRTCKYNDQRLASDMQFVLAADREQDMSQFQDCCFEQLSVEQELVH